ncbi:MAG: DUF4129 domain-containing protein [Bacteroidetes bacterium]|nr:DUF4129 domain-containing protein [Bacteroidota bacterium]
MCICLAGSLSAQPDTAFISKDILFSEEEGDDIEEKFYPQEDISLQRFDSSEWARITRELEYESLKEEEKKPAQTTSRRRETSPGMATFLKILMIGGGIALLVFILLQYFNGTDFGGKRKAARNRQLNIEIDELEKDLPDSQLDPVLQKAEQSGNYRLAIRLRYLKVIQALTEKGYIQWKKEKTNGHYSRELRGSELEMPFRKITRIFERLWYGQSEMNAAEYEWVTGNYAEMENLIARTKARGL